MEGVSFTASRLSDRRKLARGPRELVGGPILFLSSVVVLRHNTPNRRTNPQTSLSAEPGRVFRYGVPVDFHLSKPRVTARTGGLEVAGVAPTDRRDQT